MSNGHMTITDLDTLFDDGRDLSDEIATLIGTYTGWAGLEDYCRDGGTMHDVEAVVTLDEHNNDSGRITGSFEVTFSERWHLGCRDICWTNYFQGKGTLVIDTVTGEISLETSARHVPSPAEQADEDERLLAEYESLAASEKVRKLE